MGLLVIPPAAPRTGVDWPSFRGVRASGVAEGFKTPATWNVEESKGVAWKTPIPGLGHSSPVIWQNRVCVTTALSGKADAELKVGLYGDIKPVEDSTEHEWRVMCLDKKSGKVAWTQTAHKGVPAIKRHTKATHANSTLATDGENLVAFFGSEGLYTYRLSDGKLLWKKSLGVLDSGFFRVAEAQWGFASSPVIHDGKIIIQADVQKDSFIAAFDIKDGKEVWRTARADVPTWSTPGIVQEGARTQLIANGWHEIAGYDFATGKKLWTMKGGGDIPVPTPITAHGLIFITNAHGAARADLRDQAERDRRHHAAERRDVQSAHRLVRAARRHLHADADRLRPAPLREPRQRRAARLRRRHRQSPLRAAHGRRQDGLHRVTGRGGRQDLLHERGWGRLRAEGGRDLRTDRAEQDG